MDRNHPFLLVMMVVLFGVAIAGAIWIFGERNVQVRRDAMISGIQHIAADAFQYRLRPRAMGGGGGSYDTYAIPVKLRAGDVATYTVDTSSSADTLVILATAGKGGGTITASVDPTGAVVVRTLTGDLAY